MPYYPPSYSSITLAARATVRALARACPAGDTWFFVGSFGCKLFGDHVSPFARGFRTPNDIDIVVETSYSQEELKRRIVAADATFRLYEPKTYGATYKVLKYGSPPVKVDVLIAYGDLDIPSLPSVRIATIDGFPVASLALLILLRVQAWDHHRVALAAHLHAKQHVDANDLSIHLLPYAVQKTWVGTTMMDEAARYLPAELMRKSKSRIAAFVTRYPLSGRHWSRLGYVAEAQAAVPRLPRLRPRAVF